MFLTDFYFVIFHIFYFSSLIFNVTINEREEISSRETFSYYSFSKKVLRVLAIDLCSQYNLNRS